MDFCVYLSFPSPVERGLSLIIIGMNSWTAYVSRKQIRSCKQLARPAAWLVRRRVEYSRYRAGKDKFILLNRQSMHWKILKVWETSICPRWVCLWGRWRYVDVYCWLAGKYLPWETGGNLGQLPACQWYVHRDSRGKPLVPSLAVSILQPEPRSIYFSFTGRGPLLERQSHALRQIIHPI